VARNMRDVVHRTLSSQLKPPAHILDIGCGVGCDSGWLLSQGYRVTAIDQAEEMVKMSRSRYPSLEVHLCSAENLEHLDIIKPVDGVLLNFGVINAIDPVQFEDSLFPHCHKETLLYIVSMPRIHLSWICRALLKGDIKAARARLQERVNIPVMGNTIPTHYWNVSDLSSLWGNRWSCVSHQGLGVVLPPPQSRISRVASVPIFNKLECAISKLPILSELGDHCISVWKRTDSSALS
jgi:SAM-dependent methyltransferase